MNKTTKIRIVILGCIALVLIIFNYFYSNKNKIENNQISNNIVLTEEIVNNSIEKVLSEYSTESEFITPTDWPPTFQILDEKYTCTPAGNEYERAGKTEVINIDDTEYCVTKVTEGAAGSQYTQYSYSREVLSKTLILNFSFRFPQCLNYDEDKKKICLSEQEDFIINNIIDNLFKDIEK